MITFFTTNTPDQNGNPRFYRLTGLEMLGNGLPNSSPLVKGAIQLMGNGSNVRVDHCMTSNLYDDAIEVYDAVTGVADHDVFYLSGNQHAFEFTAAAWNGGLWADGSWEDTSHFGSSSFFFAEDCTFINPSNTVSTAAIDATQGARWIVRNCVVSNMFLSNHGTESGGLERGPRACEVYGNTFYSDGCTVTPNVVTFRGATGVLFSNIAICRNRGFFNNFASLNEYRMTENYPTWGISDGTNSIDQNIGGPFDTVTNIVSGTPTSLTLTVAGSPWVNNQWVGYSVVDTSQPSGATSADSTNFSIIVSNSANTAIFLSANLHTDLTIKRGDVCQFWLITNALDMPGMGQSQAVRNAAGVITNNAAGLNQVVDPIYAWSNTIDGVDSECTAIYPVMKQGVHYFNGVIKPGYTPFTYPHPLTLASSGLGAVAPLAPTNLRLAQ